MKYGLLSYKQGKGCQKFLNYVCVYTNRFRLNNLTYLGNSFLLVVFDENMFAIHSRLNLHSLNLFILHPTPWVDVSIATPLTQLCFSLASKSNKQQLLVLLKGNTILCRTHRDSLFIQIVSG
jgi:hypothetical protein